MNLRMNCIAHPTFISTAAEHTGHRRNAQLFNVFARIQVIFHIHNHLTFLTMDSELIGTSNAGAIEQRINGKGSCPRFYRIKPEGGKVGELFFTVGVSVDRQAAGRQTVLICIINGAEITRAEE